MIPVSQILLRVCLATVLGGIVGIERERSERAAGLRTHAMVGLGSAVFTIISAFGFQDILGTGSVTLDPSRIAAQIVTGIGFLGAGTIIFQHEMVRMCCKGGPSGSVIQWTKSGQHCFEGDTSRT